MMDGESGRTLLDPLAAQRGVTSTDVPPPPIGPGRRVLMVLFHFPPLGGVSMARNARNVEYLPRSGWTPVVVTSRDVGVLADWDALSSVASDTIVINARSPGPEHLRPVVNGLRRLLARRDAAAAPPGAAAAGARSAKASTSRLGRIAPLVFFPDPQVGWLPFAVAAAVQADRRQSVDAIYSTSSPITAHLVAGIVKRLTGVPWVAEFRDPWVGNPLEKSLPWFHRRLKARLERWIVHTSDRLVFVSPLTAAAYRRRYPRAAPMVVIPNGHDRSEAPSPAVQTRHEGPLRLVWAGALYRPAELELFLTALELLAARRSTLCGELEVVFYGLVSGACREVADRYVGSPVGRMIRFPGFVSRREALQAVADADAALVMLGGGPGMGQFIPGKLFDCIGQNRPVLAVLPPGDARAILAELDWGIVADPDVGSIADAIERLLEAPAEPRIADPEGRYDREVLARRLAAELDAAATVHPRSATRDDSS